MNVDVQKLANQLTHQCPEIVFALLHGSTAHGTAGPDSDLDLAVYLDDKPTLEFYHRVSAVVEHVVPGIEPDIGVLNNADVVYRFQSLTGTLLFARDPNAYASFFSITCREYESQMASYRRQHHYRLDAYQKRVANGER